jgi:N-acetylglucosaminyl-diphospho-decaprenol L-rhamnosyltransferase
LNAGHPSPSVEVLIVSYNARELLADCLKSIITHKPDPNVAHLTVRVLDNGSSDGSAEMIARQFPAVSLERARYNLGFARASNHLANSSTADYLLLLNPDTRWTRDLVEPLIEALSDSPLAVAVGPRLEWPDGTPQPSAQRFPTLGYELAVIIRGTHCARLVRRLWDVDRLINHIEWQEIDWSCRQAVPSLWATCWLMRRQDVAALGLFDERYVTYDEDLDFCRRMNARGRTCVYEPRVALVHVGGGSSDESVKGELMRRGRRLYYSLHQGRGAAFMYGRGLPALRRLHAAQARLRRRRARPG